MKRAKPQIGSYNALASHCKLAHRCRVFEQLAVKYIMTETISINAAVGAAVRIHIHRQTVCINTPLVIPRLLIKKADKNIDCMSEDSATPTLAARDFLLFCSVHLNWCLTHSFDQRCLNA